MPQRASDWFEGLKMSFPSLSSATVTGKSATSNRQIASGPRSANATISERLTLWDRSAATPPVATQYTAPCARHASATGADRLPLPMVALTPRDRSNGVYGSMRADVVGPQGPTASPGRAGAGPQ